MALLKTCPRCSKLISYELNLCEECNRDKYEYDKTRDKYKVNFYHSKEWLHTVELVKLKYKQLDIYEYYINHAIVYGNISHHIEELTYNKARRLDITNLIYLTTENHNKIHALYNKSIESKKETQRMLFELIEKWNKEMNE
jgi:hypothetical protein